MLSLSGSLSASNNHRGLMHSIAGSDPNMNIGNIPEDVNQIHMEDQHDKQVDIKTNIIIDTEQHFSPRFAKQNVNMD